MNAGWWWLAALLAVPAWAGSHHCAPGYHRSPAAAREFARLYPCPIRSDSGRCLAIIDHVVALCRGGADAPANMAWQTRAQARAKDRWELTADAPRRLAECLERGGCFLKFPHP